MKNLFYKSFTPKQIAYWNDAFDTHWESLLWLMLDMEGVVTRPDSGDDFEDYVEVFEHNVITETSKDPECAYRVKRVEVKVFSDELRKAREEALSEQSAIADLFRDDDDDDDDDDDYPLDLPEGKPEDSLTYVIDRENPPAWAVYYIFIAKMEYILEGLSDGIAELNLCNEESDGPRP
jgi:hypothetical protein